MLRVDLNRLTAGMRLALPVQHPRDPRRVLLKVGCELTRQIIEKLREHRIRYVWVRYPRLSFLEKLITRETLEHQGRVVSQIVETFETLQQGATARLRYDAYRSAIERLVQHLLSNPKAAMFLGDIDQASGDLMRHSSAVTYLCVLMGLKLEAYIVRERKHVAPARAKEVRNLGTGAMLHDIGVMQLSENVRQRYERTGDEDDPQWREHPALGFRIVRGNIDASAAAVVLHHHQRFDGLGFAGRDFPVQQRQNIHVFARIAAVADRFDRLRRPPNDDAQPTVAALSRLLTGPMLAGFDPRVVQALLAVVPPYPPGSIIRLSDGRHAVAVDHNPDQPCRPKVRIIPDPAVLDEDQPSDSQQNESTLDLAAQPPRLFVAEAEGRRVAAMNFDLPNLYVEPTVQAGA